MKYFYQLFILILIISLYSCSGDEINFIGTYEAYSVRDECPDVTNNAEIRSNEEGICLPSAENERCLSLSLQISEDGTFTFTSVERLTFAGVRLTNAPKIDSGNYTTEGNTITLNYPSSEDISLTLDDSETSLDWFLGTTPSNCSRFYRFNKTLN